MWTSYNRSFIKARGANFIGRIVVFMNLSVKMLLTCEWAALLFGLVA
jgi:hypothetical protein